jgi:hypothetical protein
LAEFARKELKLSANLAALSYSLFGTLLAEDWSIFHGFFCGAQKMKQWMVVWLAISNNHIITITI